MADVKAQAKAIKDIRKKPTTNDDTAFGDDGSKSKSKDKAIQTVDPRKFVVINPPLKTDGGVNESRSPTKIDYLIRNGLGNQDHLTYYRQAMSNPQKAIVNPNLRKYVAEVLDEVLDIIFNDTQTYNRVRTILQKDRKIDDALMAKSDRSGIDVKILREVFVRGIEHGEGDQEHAFARVNSFIAGGKARRMDADLVRDPEKSPGGIGSDEVTKRYADMTPGQSFELIKKALKGKDNG